MQKPRLALGRAQSECSRVVTLVLSLVCSHDSGRRRLLAPPVEKGQCFHGASR